MGRKPKVTAPESAPVLDLSALNHEVVELPAAARIVANRKWDVNPFVELVRATRDENKGRQVTVPAYHAREVCAGVRDAADKITAEGTPVGVRIICEWNGLRSTKVGDVPTDDTPVTVLYQAKDRRRLFTTDEERQEAIAMGFVTSDGKPTARPYFDWVEAGRPMASEEENVSGE